jgi:hypothetical protein
MPSAGWREGLGRLRLVLPQVKAAPSASESCSFRK